MKIAVVSGNFTKTLRQMAGTLGGSLSTASADIVPDLGQVCSRLMINNSTCSKGVTINYSVISNIVYRSQLIFYSNIVYRSLSNFLLSNMRK